MTRRKAIAGGALTALAVSVGALAALNDGADALPAAALAALAGASCVVLVVAVASGWIAREQRHGRRELERAAEAARRAGDRDDRAVRQALKDTAARVDEVAAQLREMRSQLTAVGERIREVPEVASRVRRLGEAVENSYAQLEAFVDVRMMVEPRRPLPPLRGWAASPDVLRHAVNEVLHNQPKLVVECGSGASSVWLGYVVQRAGSRLVCLEHDAAYARATGEMISAHGLADVVEVRQAPLEPWDEFSWYATSSLDDLSDIGMLFVDGPPGHTCEMARYPALPLLYDRLTPGALVILDDADRPDERAVSDRWLAEFPALARTRPRAEKGADLLRRSS